MDTIKKNNEELKLVVDDGTVEVPVYNHLGKEIGRMVFNPSDIGIVDRFKNAQKKFAEIVEPLSNVNIAADGTADDEESAAALKEAENKLCEFCDYLVGGNMSEAFFSAVNPFSPKNGSFYCEYAINTVAEYIAKYLDREIEKVNARVEKYIHGYRTGAHKNGKR